MLTLPTGVPTFNAVLRVFSATDSTVYSSAWRIDRRATGAVLQVLPDPGIAS